MWGIEVWSDEEELWAPTEEPRLPSEHGALIRCAELLIETRKSKIKSTILILLQ